MSGEMDWVRVLTFGGAQDMDRIEVPHAVVICDWNKGLHKARPVNGSETPRRL